jgi:CRP-like cAMP-binding protein
MIANQINLFRTVSSDARSQISSIGVELTFEKGSVLFRRGDKALHLYVLVGGTVCLDMGKGMPSQLLMNSGETFGLSSMIETDVYPVTATCWVPTKVIKIEAPLMSSVLETRPESGVAFFRQLARALESSLLETHRTKH